MIVINEETENKLIRTLDINKAQNNKLRCVHIKTTQIDGFDLETIIQFIYDNIDDQNGLIFVCKDKDIFILARGLGSPFTKLFENTFYPTPRSTKPAHSTGLASLFEIRVDRRKLADIIEAKLIALLKQEEKKEEKEKEEKKEEVEKARQTILSKPIALGLIKSLSRRRHEREDIKILIVEDDLFSQKLIVNTLPKTINVSTANNGENALDQYFTNAPDVLFLDIGLPDIDGHDVLSKVIEHDPHAFVIMLSGKGDKHNITKAMENGAKGFVGKPFTREKLIQYIEKSPHIHTSVKKGAVQ